MRHSQFGGQARQDGDFHDPFAFVCPTSIDSVLALACQLENQVYEADEHPSPLRRWQRGRARGEQSRHLVANGAHEGHKLHRNLPTTDLPRALPTTVHNLRGVEVTPEASQVVRSQVWRCSIHSCCQARHGSNVDQTNEVAATHQNRRARRCPLTEKYRGTLFQRCLQFYLIGGLGWLVHGVLWGSDSCSEFGQQLDIHITMQTSDARTYAITRLPCCTCPTCEKLSFTHRLRSTASARASQRIFAQAALKCVCWQSRTDQQRGYDIHLKRNLDNAFASGALCRSPRHTAATRLSCPRWGDEVFHLHASQHRGCGLSLAHRFQGSNETPSRQRSTASR